MERLKQIFEEQWTPFVNHMNELFLSGNVIHISWKDMISGLKTQEITKILSPIFTHHLGKFFAPHGLILCEENSKDIRWFDEDCELKITLSLGNGWTGNGFKKVNWHLLIKLKMNSQGLIEQSFCCLVPINECQSSWTTTSQTNNFSSLKLLVEDEDKIIVLHGKMKANSRFFKPVLL